FSAALRENRGGNRQGFPGFGCTVLSPAFGPMPPFPILRNLSGDFGAKTQPSENPFRLVRLLAASVGQVVAFAATEISRSRWQVQLTSTPAAGDTAHDQRADEPPSLTPKLCRGWFEADGNPNVFGVSPTVMQRNSWRVVAPGDEPADRRFASTCPGPSKRTCR